jgi:hypothetical protein
VVTRRRSRDGIPQPKEHTMPSKSPQRAGNKKKATKSLKEKRMAKRSKRSDSLHPTLDDDV